MANVNFIFLNLMENMCSENKSVQLLVVEMKLQQYLSG